MATTLMNKADAAAISGLSVGVISLIAQMAGSGYNARATLDYASAITEGRDPGSLPERAVKSIVIQAYSFLKDPCQYNGTYGVSEDRIEELRRLYKTDKAACFADIEAIVSERIRARGSPKGVSITDRGAPGLTPPEGADSGSPAGQLRALKAVIAQDSGLYGRYRFEADDSNRPEAHRFSVPLGQGLIAVGRSKDFVVVVARLCRVRGRSDPLIESYVAYLGGANRLAFGEDIPEDVFDGRLGPRDHIPVRASVAAPSVVPGGSVAAGRSPPLGGAVGSRQAQV